jgi:hypothetical protein
VVVRDGTQDAGEVAAGGGHSETTPLQGYSLQLSRHSFGKLRPLENSGRAGVDIPYANAA